MMSAAEAAIDASAADDKERARTRARLYAPPKGENGPRKGRARPTGMRMTKGQANTFLAQAAAQDAQARGMPSG